MITFVILIIFNFIKSLWKTNIAKQIAFAFLLLFLSRLVWFFVNFYWLPDVGTLGYIKSILLGIYFDIPVIAYLFAPLFLWQFVLPSLSIKYPSITKILFLLPSAICLILNGIDTGFSKINGKRTGYELFAMITDEGNNIAPYLSENILSLAALFLSFYLIFKLTPTKSKVIYLWNKQHIVRSMVAIPMVLVIWIVAGRGGLQLRPLRSIDASNYVEAEISPLVYSTPLHILSTWKKSGKFFEQKPCALNIAEAAIYQKKFGLQSVEKKNLVVIVVESLARDYTGFLNNAPFTPFLDSLSKSCINFTHCFANGTKSIDMVPAIFSGLPNLMDEPYILSTYNTNKIENAFKKYSDFGYSTSFFHGSNNGTMGFKAFFKQTGLQHYFGIDEYPTKDKDYDGNWGIWDEAYLQYYANCIDTLNRPFFSSVFTLSSHHPYEIPQKYEAQLPFSKRTIQRSIGYTDICLRKFFETARKKDWFKNTVFVITGDHTSHGVLEYFYSAAGHYEVPFLIYNSGLPAVANHKSVSQCDILPTVSSVLDNKINLEGLGRNALDSSYKGYSMHYDNGLFYMVQYPFVLAVDVNGKTSVYQKQYRNAPKPIKLPQSGAQYNSMRNILTKYLFVYSENIKNNHWH